GEVVEVIDFLGRYVISHFTAEEGLMKQNGYPGLAAHQQLHRAFETDFAELKREYESNGSSSLLVIQVQRRVIDWLMKHIIREDKRIAEFLRSRA
ncbi:MAG: hemerythrin, partial [Symbiobacteriaceae bacterium]|nr:hemerythrin [Symbiobacteriaceae bacterium]